MSTPATDGMPTGVMPTDGSAATAPCSSVLRVDIAASCEPNS